MASDLGDSIPNTYHYYADLLYFIISHRADKTPKMLPIEAILSCDNRTQSHSHSVIESCGQGEGGREVQAVAPTTGGRHRPFDYTMTALSSDMTVNSVPIGYSQ